VEGVLDTAVHALIDNPDRTWVYADLAFFVKWWQELHPGICCYVLMTCSIHCVLCGICVL